MSSLNTNAFFPKKGLSGETGPNQADLEKRAQAALSWLLQSIEATGGKGSAHHYSPFFGWGPAYPETTGYLIETLLDYAQLTGQAALQTTALGCADWLLEVQLPNGAFPGGTLGNRHPSVFNTAQILFGLARAQETRPTPQTREAGVRALQWLLAQLETDGSWRKWAYIAGFTPSYYTRAVWGVLKAAVVFQMPEVQPAMRQALHYYAERFQPNGTVRDWGFKAGTPAFTHTIAYTLEGFLECALLLNETAVLQQTTQSAARLWQIRQQNGQTAGRYDAQWKGDYGFTCPTGNAQLSVLYHRLWQTGGEPAFRTAASTLLLEVLPHQNLGRNPHRHGAIPGSAPFWGPYMRFRYPNWAAKFFLDAVASFEF